MGNRAISAVWAALFLAAALVSGPASAENRMGYRLLSAEEASALPRRGGALGLAVGPAKQVTDSGMTFEILRVTAVRRGSPGSQAGLKPNDYIIAADGRVFPSVAAFGAYVGSVQQGDRVSLDYIPAGGGPKDAQRVAVLAGRSGNAAPSPSPGPAEPARSEGLSTGAKIAIGAGAAALFGCYKYNCLSRLKNSLGQGRATAPAAQFRR